MKKTIEFIEKHPYFIKRKDTLSSYGFALKGNHRLFLKKDYDPTIRLPIFFELFDDISELWKKPLFIRQFFNSVNNHYYEEQKLRMIVAKQKRPISNLISCFSILQEKGESFEENISIFNILNREIEFSSFHFDLIDPFASFIEPYGYTLVIKKQKKHFLSIIIHEKNA